MHIRWPWDFCQTFVLGYFSLQRRQHCEPSRATSSLLILCALTAALQSLFISNLQSFLIAGNETAENGHFLRMRCFGVPRTNIITIFGIYSHPNEIQCFKQGKAGYHKFIGSVKYRDHLTAYLCKWPRTVQCRQHMPRVASGSFPISQNSSG